MQGHSLRCLAAARRVARGSVSRVLSGGVGLPLSPVDGHSSRTGITPGLKQPTRTAGPVPALRSITRPRAVPIRSCSRWGLPCRLRYRSRGALLPHPFSLAGANPGGLLSVALSLGSPPPGVTRHRRSVEPGLSSPVEDSGDRPILWPRPAIGRPPALAKPPPPVHIALVVARVSAKMPGESL